MDYEDKQFQTWVRRIGELELAHAVNNERIGRLERRLQSVLREGVTPKSQVCLEPAALRSGVSPGPVESSATGSGGIAPSEARDFTFADEAVV